MNDDFLGGIALFALPGSCPSDGQVAAVLALLVFLFLLSLVGAVAVFHWRRLLVMLVFEVGLCLLEPLRLLGGASPTDGPS